ncbi:FecR domain-containing protein [Bradyrhizobium sp. Ai1a-2]|uniref:FecR family protein n=1 Tax=Bradyrhizobium sp. Ai1a-2 TaxID=196490 RepID=UPI000424B940|nr:FecR domain-containing protein [Bradyrhizobium sp. Ai1a-2]
MDSAAILKRDARRWVTELASGEANMGDFEKAERWRRQSPAHEAAFAEATRLWSDFAAAGRRLIAEEGKPAWVPPPSPTSRRAMLAGTGALAASAAAYAVINPPLALWPSLDEFRADYRTAIGEQRRVMLADEISVRMNTRTSIAIPQAVDTDQITLIAGEAFFAMPKQPKRSLTVVAADGRSTTTRAQFDVRNIDSSVCVTCFDGEVRIEQQGRVATIGANRQLRYDKAGLGEVTAVDAADAAAWRDGILIFRYTPLSDVIAEINRYRPGRVILVNTELAQRSVNGRFKIERIDEILLWIAQVYGVKPRSLPGGIMLLS